MRRREDPPLDRDLPELVPTWAKVAAWAVPLTTIPSIAWRMISLIGGLVSGDDPCFTSAAPLGEKLYLLAVLPSVQLGLALLTVGLIRPWGEGHCCVGHDSARVVTLLA